MDPIRHQYKVSPKVFCKAVLREAKWVFLVVAIMLIACTAMLISIGPGSEGFLPLVGFAFGTTALALVAAIVLTLSKPLAYTTKHGIHVYFEDWRSYIPEVVVNVRVGLWILHWDSNPATTVKAREVLYDTAIFIDKEMYKVDVVDADAVSYAKAGAVTHIYKKHIHIYEGLSQSWETWEYELGHLLVNAELPGDIRDPDWEESFAGWRERHDLLSSGTEHLWSDIKD